MEELEPTTKKLNWTNIFTWFLIAIFSAGIFAKTPEYNPINCYLNVTRPINSTAFTISPKIATVYYTINISCTATIGSNATGKVALQYFNSSNSTWTDISDVYNSNTVTLAAVLQSVNAQDVVLSGVIPAGAQTRLVSTSTGTTTITYIRGEEVY